MVTMLILTWQLTTWKARTSPPNLKSGASGKVQYTVLLYLILFCCILFDNTYLAGNQQREGVWYFTCPHSHIFHSPSLFLFHCPYRVVKLQETRHHYAQSWEVKTCRDSSGACGLHRCRSRQLDFSRRWATLYCTVPYRTVPYCTVLYHIVPNCTVPDRTVLYRTVLYRVRYLRSCSIPKCVMTQ